MDSGMSLLVPCWTLGCRCWFRNRTAEIRHAKRGVCFLIPGSGVIVHMVSYFILVSMLFLSQYSHWLLWYNAKPLLAPLILSRTVKNVTLHLYIIYLCTYTSQYPYPPRESINLEQYIFIKLEIFVPPLMWEISRKFAKPFIQFRSTINNLKRIVSLVSH